MSKSSGSGVMASSLKASGAAVAVGIESGAECSSLKPLFRRALSRKPLFSLGDEAKGQKYLQYNLVTAKNQL